NVWTACTTLAQVLESTQEPPGPEDPQILILDRGLFDSLCWLAFMDRLSRLRTDDRERIENFLLIDDWRKRITGVVVMTTTPGEALKREQGFLPVETTGSIMNPEVLGQVLITTKDCMARLKDKFRLFEVSTGGPKSKPQKTAEEVAAIVLDLIEEQLTERILHINATKVKEAFSGRTTIVASEARGLLEAFKREGEFETRDLVERDLSSVQALPVVVVRNKSGEVLRLRRREKDPKSGLHEKLVIWAGGHVREEDSHNGDPILLAAQRELQEELRLSVEGEELHLLGAVYADSGGKTSRHVALVYEWRAETDDVAVTLSTAEFFERRGTSLSGKFVSLETLAKDIDEGEMKEPWSTEIASQLLPQADAASQRRLF
ncbi:MAG TPA: NUDIX domain-containing protein, partial [Thermoanaerobaculia bacterium]|nr:NUDIX domain-containing protein [Thermoanaerobaculia bacterium]